MIITGTALAAISVSAAAVSAAAVSAAAVTTTNLIFTGCLGGTALFGGLTTIIKAVKKQRRFNSRATRHHNAAKKIEAMKNIITVKKSEGAFKTGGGAFDGKMSLPDLLGEKKENLKPTKYRFVNQRNGVSVTLYKREIDTIEKLGFFGPRNRSSLGNAIDLYVLLTGSTYSAVVNRAFRRK